MAETPHVQYVYMDIVGFTKGRSVEAQEDIVKKLNEIVVSVVSEEFGESDKPSYYEENPIYLPTGDGMAIGFLDSKAVDTHIRVALSTLREATKHNASTEDEKRKFEIRVGLNENMDNIVTDINGKQNLAGAGISRGQRVMDKADAGQILVGQAVHEILQQREKYADKFDRYYTSDKHGNSLIIYQFKDESPGLNVDVPSAFRVDLEDIEEEIKLTELMAYYIAHAVQNRAFLLSLPDISKRDNIAVIFLYFLAEDSVTLANTPEYEEPTLHAQESGDVDFQERFKYYENSDVWILFFLERLLIEKHLSKYYEYFQLRRFDANFWLVNSKGLKALQREFPKIAKQFNIANLELSA